MLKVKIKGCWNGMVFNLKKFSKKGLKNLKNMKMGINVFFIILEQK